ncbi:MAG: urate hydroxylase PuuD [Pseudomonadota bacterium]
MEIIVTEWISLLLRWTHLIVGIAWIGSSFYFIWLDLSLRRRDGLPEGVAGETWMVHGGGFYQAQKYLVAPPSLPAELHWFKYEAYFTWITGFLLLAVIYYWGAESFLIDPQVLALEPWVAILLSLGLLAGGWIAYDLLCKSPLGKNTGLLAVLVFVLTIVAAVIFTHIFSGRAAFLHVGAFLGTIMAANVFFVIIPNQKKTVAAMTAGEEPDPALGLQAKQRSTHNNYLTLPVLLMMISNHYPIVYGHAYSWLIVAGVVLFGGIVRHFFNTKNAGGKGMAIAWQLPLAAVITLCVIWFSGLRFGETELAADETVTAADALAIVQVRCTSCHSANPTDEGFEEAPGGLMLDTAEQLRANASRVLAQTVLTDTMPLGNMTEMTPEERARLGLWIRQGTPD